MTNLTIRFVSNPGWVSRLVAWETNSLWSHTEALSRDGQHWIGAHAGTGVQARPLDWCLPLREAQYAVPVPDDEAANAFLWIESKLGQPYNYEDIMGLALHRRIGLGRQRVICSALMLEFLWRAGEQPLNVQSGFEALVTPETLHLSPIFLGRRIR